MSLYHAYTQTVADGTATSVVRPSDWNSAHVQQWALSGNTSGSSQVSGLDVTFVGGNNLTLSADTAASKLVFSVGNYLTAQSTQPVAYSAANGSANFSTLVFANSNGVSFSTGTQGLYATVKTDYLTSQTVQTQASGAIAGTGFTSTTTAGTAVVGTLSTNGISLGIPAYITTYVNDLTSGRAGTGFTSTTTAGTAITAALGTNGLSMAVPNFITTARASNDAIGLNTSQSNVTWTVNSSGLSLDARGYAGTGTSATNASLTLNSNGLAISVNAGGVNQTGPNIADGNGVTITSGTVVFSNSNGVSFGLNGSTMTASVDAGGGGIAIEAGGGTASTGTVVFSNSNNITFGLNNNTITASYADPYETILIYPPFQATTVGAPINATQSIIFLPLDHNLKATRLDLLGSISVATNNNASTGALFYTLSAVLYSRNGNTLSSMSSAAGNSSMTWSSNNTALVTGAKLFSAPLTVSTDQGYYWLGVQLSTAATGQTGANTTSLGNTISMMGVGSAQFGAFSVGEFGAATNSSQSWIPTGLYSGTTNRATVGLSNISHAGTFGNRAQVAVRMWST